MSAADALRNKLRRVRKSVAPNSRRGSLAAACAAAAAESDSDDDEPTIAGVDWAKEGAKQLGPDKYDATLRKRDAKLKTTSLDLDEQRGEHVRPDRLEQGLKLERQAQARGLLNGHRLGDEAAESCDGLTSRDQILASLRCASEVEVEGDAAALYPDHRRGQRPRLPRGKWHGYRAAGLPSWRTPGRPAAPPEGIGAPGCDRERSSHSNVTVTC